MSWTRMRAVLVAASAVLVGCSGSGRNGSAGADAVDVDATSKEVENGKLRAVLNEIDVRGRDWIELYNPHDQDVDLSGFKVSDDPSRDTHVWALPPGSVVPKGGFLVVKEEKNPGDGTGFPFGIKKGETVYLLAPDGSVLEKVTVGDPPEGTTWGRYPDGSGDWQVTAPTQGAPNELVYDLDQILFDSTNVIEVELTLPQESYDALKKEPYKYVRGSVKVTSRGKTYEAEDIGVRLKGGQSFKPITEKAAFKLKFDEFQKGRKFLGLRRLTLNNMVDDPTAMRETLAYRVFREASLPAARTGYARVRVNGELYGLYVVLEAYDEVAMHRWFKNTRHVYEGSVDLYKGQAQSFDVDVGSKSDRSDLEALIAAINDAPTETWYDDVSYVADLYQMIGMWAAENYVGQTDGYAAAANNYFLHSNKEGYFRMLPWGMDRTFVERPKMPSGSSILVTRCMELKRCKDAYRVRLGLLLKVVEGLELEKLVDKLDGVVRPELEDDPRKPYSLEEHDQAVSKLRAYLEQRKKDAKAALSTDSGGDE